MTVLRSPALHFALIGLLAFLALGDGRPELEGVSDSNQVPWARVQMVHGQLAKEQGRPLNELEKAEATQLIVDREVLYRYSQEVGLQHDPVVQRRLAQIAKFVAETPSEHGAAQDSMQQEIEFGLMEGDPVIRRVMVDSARRLIRATALVREPDEASMQRYLEQHQDDFQLPRKTRISHVTLNRSRGKRTRAAAERMLVRLVEDNADPEDATKYGDPSVVPASLPAITDQSLERRFGRDFVLELAEVPVGSWQGPIGSRMGEHIVFVHERVPVEPARLNDVRDQISTRMRNELADKILRARLDELQARYGVYVQEPPS